MQKKLLVEEGLTFAHAVEIAQSMESAAQKTKLLQITATTVSPTPVHSIMPSALLWQHRPHPASLQEKTNRQSPSHNRRGKRGGARSRKHYAGGRGYNRSVRMIEEQFDSQVEDDEDYVESAALNLNHIRALNQLKSEPAQPYFVDLELDGNSLIVEVDTGACMPLVLQQTF